MSPPTEWILYPVGNSGKLLRGLGERGITLLMSTPYLDEAERADGVAMPP